MFKNLRLFIKIGRFITRLVDLKELVEHADIKEILKKITDAVDGKRLKLTEQSIFSFIYILKVIAEMGGIVTFREFVETIYEDDEADILLIDEDNTKSLSVG